MFSRRSRDLILYVRDVGRPPANLAAAKVSVLRRINYVVSDADLLAEFCDGPGYDRPDAELRRDLPQIRVRPAKLKARTARYDL